MQYYFAFFPNIELAYCHIVDAWKNNPEYKDKMQQQQQQQQQQQPTSPTYSSFLSFDNFLQNISPAALPTVFMNKIIGQHQNEEEPEESLSQASDTTSQQSSVIGRHHRSSSLSTLRQYITPGYLYNKISSSHEGSNPNNAATSSTSSTHLKPQPSKSRHYRATSITSLLSSGHKGKTLSRDHPVGEIWASSRLSGLLKKHYQAPIGQHKSPYELEQEQAAMNKRLDKHFPMLLNAEKVDASKYLVNLSTFQKLTSYFYSFQMLILAYYTTLWENVYNRSTPLFLCKCCGWEAKISRTLERCSSGQ